MSGAQNIRWFLDAFRRRYLTISSLVALALGSGLGLFVYFHAETGLSKLTDVLDPLVSGWVAALKVVTIPLVVAYLIVAIVSFGKAKDTGKLGGLVVLLHTGMALGGLACALLASKYVIPLVNSNLDVLRPHLGALHTPHIGGRGAESVSFWDGVIGQFWTNPLTAILKGQVLPLLFWALAISFALRITAEAIRRPVLRFLERTVDLGQLAVAALLVLMPVIVFGLLFSLVAGLGLEVLGALGYYIVMLCTLASCAMVLLYLIMPLTAGIPIREFARALIPSQILAIGSRSSLACLPTLIEGAEKGLRVDRKVAEFVLPLSVSTFKLSRAVTTPFKFFFLVNLFGVNLDPTVAVVFISAEFALSYGSPGLPSGSFLVMLPVYVAAGIPVEGYALLLAVDAIPDVFKTLLNVTEDLALVAMVRRITARTVAPNKPMVEMSK
jgi:Na+/H+-dicarboxylate symporter